MVRCLYFSRVALIAVAALSLTACDKLTGESPKIISKDTPAPAQTPAATPSTQPVAAAPIAKNATSDGESGVGSVATSSTTLSTTDAGTSPGAPPALAVGAIPPPLTAPDPVMAEMPGLYLRQAQASTVFWRGWNPEAFREAEARGLPVVIVIGSAWSHDARIMDNHVFSDPEISQKLNSEFIPIRVDADERPDIWARYRLAYEVINQQRAKPPLIAFALSDGRPFDIVGAVPAHGTGDNSGMAELMTQASDMIKTKKAEVTTQVTSIETVLSQLLSAPRAESVTLSTEVLDSMAAGLAAASTGSQAEELRAGRVGDFLFHQGSGKSRDAASALLLDRFRSGQRDHVMGGYFFRIPGSGEVQFGKLLPVQAEMISANARAYASTGKGMHKEAVGEVLRFCRDWLEAPEGGFYACQAPDTTDDDSGGYFTWSQEEVVKAAEDDKAAIVFSQYLNVAAGKKTNLHVTDKLQKAADAAGVSYADALKDLDTVRIKLRNVRMGAEQVPMVDKSILAGWNGDMINAYLEAAEFTGDSQAKDFALKTADMVIESMVSEQDGVARVLYKGKASGFGYLEDNVKVASALVKCYQVTNQKEYLDSAQSLMDFVEGRFLDKDSGLYQDVAANDPAQQAGLLKLKWLPLEDDIARSSNAVAAMVWYQLFEATKNEEFKNRATRMVSAAIQRRAFNTEALATWGEAALLLLNGPPTYKK